MPRRRRLESASHPYSTISTTGVSTTRAASGTIPTGTVINPSARCAQSVNEQSQQQQQQQQLETQDCQVSSTTTSLMQEIQSFPLVTTLQIQQNDPELDADKKTIMNHPLYPLLALLLQQCEMASARPDSPPPLDAFNAELKAYVQRQVELEDADLGKSAKQREKPYYVSGGTAIHPPPPYESAYNLGRSVSTRGGRHHGKLNSHENAATTNTTTTTTTTGELGFGKSSRPQSRNDCRIHMGEKTRDCEKSALIDGEYGHDSGAENTPFDEDRKLNVFVNNSELDELIVKAIQVLRIHLLELHKVNELCKDFCSRYIHSLKTKFQTDPLIHDSSQPSSPGESEAQSPNPASCYGQRYFPSGAMPGFPCPLTGEMGLPDYRRRQPTGLEDGDRFRAAVAAAAAAGVVAHGAATGLSPPTQGTAGAGYPHSGPINGSHNNPPGYHNTDMTGLCYTPNCHMLDYGTSAYSLKQHHGPSAASEDDSRADGFAHLHPFLSPYHNNAHNMAAFHAGLDNLCVGIGKQKRGVLPKRATQIMKQWLFQHLVHPYPTEDEKRQIANQTNLTLLQVNNWFINARRRILQPMLDASNFVPLGNSLSGVDGGGSMDNGNDGLSNSEQPVINKKKKAATSRPSNNRFWPASLVAAAAIHPVAAGLVSSGSNTLNTSSSGAIYTTCQNGIRTGERNLESTGSSDDDKSKDTENYSVLNKSSHLDGPVRPSAMRYNRIGMPDSYVISETRHFPPKIDETETWSTFTSGPATGVIHPNDCNLQFDSSNQSNAHVAYNQTNHHPPPPPLPSQHHQQQNSAESFPPHMHIDGSQTHLTYRSPTASLVSGSLGDCNPKESTGQSTASQPDAFSSSTCRSGPDAGYHRTQEPNNSNSGERLQTHTDFSSPKSDMKPQKMKQSTETSGSKNPTQTVYKPSPDRDCMKDPLHDRNSPSNCTSNAILRNSTTSDIETPVDRLLRNVPESSATNASLRSQTQAFGHLSADRNPVTSFNSQMTNNLAHSEMIFGLDYTGKLNQFQPNDYPPSSDAPPQQQQQQQQGQSYSNYLASGMVLTNPSVSDTGTGLFQSSYAPDAVGNHPELAPNPFSHLSPFYNPAFPTTNLLPHCSSRSDPMGPPPSFFTGLGDPWNSGQNVFGSGASSACSSTSGALGSCHPFPMSWTTKFRRSTSTPPPPHPPSSTVTTSSGSTTDLPMDTGCSNTPLSVADYPFQFHPKLARMHVQANGIGQPPGGLMPVEYSSATTASANMNQSDYMRLGHPTSTGGDGNFLTKPPFTSTLAVTTCNYPQKSAMAAGSHSVFKLSSPYLSTPHSLAP